MNVFRRAAHRFRRWRIVGWCALGGAFLIGPVGFLLFTFDALRAPPAELPRQCGGIVALTGGKDRVAVSLALLRAHPSHDLLISGVAPDVTLDQIAFQNDTPLSPGLARHITLGRRAVSTVGNGRETAQWAHENDLSCLVVVTAGYHMRRAILEIHQADPTLRLSPWRVQPPAMRPPWQMNASIVLVHEYAKLLGALARDSLHPPGRHHGMRG